MQADYQQAYIKLIAAKKVFIFGHPKCGDSLGSTLAMTIWLESLGKKCAAFSADDIPGSLSFLPKNHRIVKKLDNINLSEFDTILVLDTDFPHSGILEKLESELSAENNFVINIDHHISNPGAGDLNLIDVSASSTAKMVYDFFLINKININREMAVCLLTGIFYDTGIFSNAATDRSSLASAADLLARGVSLKLIYSDLINNKSIALLKLWGKVLSRLTNNRRYDIVHTFIMQADDDSNQAVAKTGDLANFLNNLNEGKFSLIVNEGDGGLIKVSLRTTRDDVDVAKFAHWFGGGGHRKSAGFALPGSLVYNEHEGKIKII